MKKIISLVVALCLAMVCFIGCGSEAYADVYDSKSDKKATINIGDKLAKNQPTPTDIDYSLAEYKEPTINPDVTLDNVDWFPWIPKGIDWSKLLK